MERGLKRREAEGLDNSELNPVCTIMVGRLDDWLRETADKKNISVDPCALHYAGIACMKKAYKVYKEKGYKTKLLSAAYRDSAAMAGVYRRGRRHDHSRTRTRSRSTVLILKSRPGWMMKWIHTISKN